MNEKKQHFLQLSLVVLSVLVLSASLFLQYVQELEPCALCIMQRLCVILLTILTLLGCLCYSKRWYSAVKIVELLIAAAGLYFASRQLWLQSLPADAMPACLPDLSVLLRYFPWQQIIHALVWGTAECGKVSTTILGLSLPVWPLLYFSMVMLIIGASYLRRFNR